MTHIISSSLDISGSLQATSFTGDGTNILNVQTASFASTASYALTSQGGGGEGGGFPHTGSAIISGSLTVTGSLNLKGLTTGSGVTQNLVLDNGEVKVQGIDEGTSGGIQPTVQILSESKGIIDLDTTQYNGFDITPSNDITVNFNVGSNKFYNFDLVWTNKVASTLIHFNLQDGSHSGFFYTDDEFKGSYDSQTGVYFINNGLTAYVGFDDPQKTIVEYTLEYPYTLDSTATQTGKTLDVDSEISSEPTAMQFNSNGTKIFVLELDERIHQYNLGTAYDISTATYSGNFYQLTTSNSTRNFILSPDDSKIWWADRTSIRQVELTTPGDISSATDTGVSFDLSDQGTSFKAFTFSSDGKSFIASNDGIEQKFYKYNLSTPYDITTAIYDSDSGTLDFTVHSTTPFNIVSSHDDKLLILIDTSQDPTHLEYFDISDPAPFNIAKTEYNGSNFDVGSQEGFPLDFTFNPDGTKMFVIGIRTTSAHQYTLSTPFDITTTSYASTAYNVGVQDTIPMGIAFNDTGTKMFIVGASSKKVYQYSISTPFNVGTGTYDNVFFDVTTQDSSPQGIVFNDTGTKMFIVGNSNNSIYQYTLPTPFVLTGASYDNVSFNPNDQEDDIRKCYFSTFGTKMFIIGHDSNNVHQYTLSTPFDISTTSYDNVKFDFSSQQANAYGIALNDNDTKMYVVGSNISKIYEYDIFDGVLDPDAILTLPENINWAGGSAPTFSSENQKDWFRFESVDNGTSWLGEIKRQGF